jgi:integrase
MANGKSFCHSFAIFCHELKRGYAMDERGRIDFDTARLKLSKREDAACGSWRAVLSYKTITDYKPDGSPVYSWKQKNKSFKTSEYATQRSAQIAANKWVEQLQAEQNAAVERVAEAERERADELARANTVSVADYVDGFVERYRGAHGSLEESTRRDYRVSAKHIRAAFADVPLPELTAKAVDEWLVSMQDGHSQSSQRKAYILLNLACKYAVRDGDIEVNPVEAVRPPAGAKADPNALTLANRDYLVNELRRFRPTPVRTAAMLALYMGLRVGEIAALQWGDVDLKRKEIDVHAAIGQGKGATYRKGTKSEASNRRLPIPESLVAPLKERRALMRGHLASAGVRLNADEFARLYVVGTIDGAYKNPNYISKEWRVLAENLGLTGSKGRIATFHDLRHTFATVAVANHVDVKSVQSYLGHASAAMTLNVYADADEDAKRRAAEAMDGALNPDNHESAAPDDGMPDITVIRTTA